MATNVFWGSAVATHVLVINGGCKCMLGWTMAAHIPQRSTVTTNVRLGSRVAVHICWGSTLATRLIGINGCCTCILGINGGSTCILEITVEHMYVGIKCGHTSTCMLEDQW